MIHSTPEIMKKIFKFVKMHTCQEERTHKNPPKSNLSKNVTGVES